jgi:hypothetical protein
MRLAILWIVLSVFSLPQAHGLGAGNAASSGAVSKSPFSKAVDFREEIYRRGLRYFQENAHPVTGLVRDRADNFESSPDSNRAASIAATGFGLAVMANASLEGLVSREDAEAYVLKTLRSARALVPRYHGWFVHFVDWESGKRLWNSEFSTIDSALFFAGALYAAEVFPGNAEIRQIAQTLYREADYSEFLTDGGLRPHKRTLSMAYTPENGFTPAQWDMYAEEMILLILGLGHPDHPLPTDAWFAWRRDEESAPDGRRYMGLRQALFIHQYSLLYLDLSRFHDGYPNYWENSRMVSDYHRRLSAPEARFRALREGFWGFSAGDSLSGYQVLTALEQGPDVCIDCAAGSLMFAPSTVLADLERWANGPYREKIWGRYGFIDSLDLDNGWFDREVIGITVGTVVLSAANSGLKAPVWRDFQKIPAVRAGLESARSLPFQSR